MTTKQQIKRWDNGNVIFEGEYDTREAAILGAVAAKVNLSRSNLSGSNLSRSNLSGSDLSGSDLSGSNLSGAKGVLPSQCTPLLMLLDQPGKIRAYKLVTADGVGPFNGGIVYEVGKKCEVKDANTDVNTPCGAGINLATLDWCLKEWEEGYKILLAEFSAKDIAAIPTATDGKFRVHRCEIVGEVDLKKIGWLPNREETKP